MVEIGAVAPEFELEDHAGRSHALKRYRGRWVVLYFYPQDDTAGCTAQACSFRDNMARFTAHDAVVLGVSADDRASHRAFAAKHDLSFPLLVDPKRTVIEAYGAWVEKSAHGRAYMGVPRLTYLIGPDGRVAEVWPNVVVEGHVDEVIAAIERLSAAPAS